MAVLNPKDYRIIQHEIKMRDQIIERLRRVNHDFYAVVQKKDDEIAHAQDTMSHLEVRAQKERHNGRHLVN